MDKKKIIRYIVIAIAVILVVVLFLVIRNARNKKIEREMTSLYNKAHELYQYGGDITYSKNEDGTRVYKEVDGTKYYQIANFNDSVAKYFSDNNLKNVIEYMNIIEENGNYYIKDFGRGIGNYFDTTLKVKKVKGKKRILTASSRFCKIEHQVTYGDLCRGDNEYTIEKEFVLVKVNGNWKIDSYTSIFQMGDEIK